MKALRVKVGRKQINNGDQGEAESCPIALGVQDIFAELGIDVTANVTGLRTEVRIPEQTLTFTTTPKAAKFIDKFDDDRMSVKPLTVTLPPMPF